MPREGETAGERERRKRQEARNNPTGAKGPVDMGRMPQWVYDQMEGDFTPQPFFGQGPTPADMMFRRGTPQWKQALDPRRRWAVGELWDAHVGQGLNLSDLSDGGAVDRFLRGLDITSEKGGGRHLRNLILGRLPEEGFGINDDPRRMISWGMERFMPDWKVGMDQAVQGGHLTRDRVTGLYVNPGRDPQNPEWYDSYGRRVAPPYSGPWKTAEELEYEQQIRQRESQAQGITYENADSGGATPPPATTPQTSAANRSIPAAITGFSTNPAGQNTTPGGSGNKSPFYTSPTPPSGIGINFNLAQQQPKKKTKPTGPMAATSPSAAGDIGTGWRSTWA